MLAELPRVEESESNLLKVHLDPAGPVEIPRLTAALGSLARQYQQFAINEGLAKGADARLLISNVAPGSIDINFVPDFHTIVGTMMPLVPALHDRAEIILKFAKRIKAILDAFLDDPRPDTTRGITVRDCDDAANIVSPIAAHGGSQSFTVINGDVHNTIMAVSAQQAREIVERTSSYKGKLLEVGGDQRQRVALVWTQLARDAARIEGKKSPDRGTITEIDPKPHPVFFTDEMSFLKKEMIDDEENPYKKVFFVDVEISRVPGGGVGNYRITAYHGKDDYEPPSNAGTPLLPA